MKFEKVNYKESCSVKEGLNLVNSAQDLLFLNLEFIFS